MTNVKNLDCVELKNTIQAKLLKEYHGLQPEEAKRRLHQKLQASNSPVAKLWKELEVEQQLKKAG